MSIDLNLSEVELSLKVAHGFCEEINGVFYCLEEDCFYIYEHGVYRKIFTREMHEIVLSKKSLTKKMTLQGLKNVVDRIATIKQVRIERFNMDELVNFPNGLFYLDTFQLKKHTEEVLSTIRLPYKYSSSALCPLWEKSINEIMDNDKNKIRTLQEFFGYCLTREVKFEKALIITGEGANGKSTILNTLKFMVGVDNCSALSLRYFNNPQKTSVLKGKLLNICTEVPKKVEDYEAEFRTIVTGEDLLISPKYVPDYNITPHCKLVMAVNEFPHIDDKTSAFYRRLLMIDLKRQFSEETQNKDLRAQLLEELPGIFNWSLEGLKRLMERGTFLIDEYMKQSIEQMKEMNNPIMAWANESIIVLKGDDLNKSDAFDEYRKWSEKNGYKSFGMNKFSTEIYKLFSDNTEKDRRSKMRLRVWPNLALRTPENELRILQNPENLEWKE